MYKSVCLVLVLIACASVMNSPTASAMNRHALIVGNGDYSTIGRLKNPSADAQLMANTLRLLDFDVILLLDASQQEMKRQIAEFGRELRRSSKDAVGFFFYAGHGIQADGRNYLLPVEATPTDQADLDLMGVEANWVLRQMESAGNRTNIIVLDACRNNPFTTSNRSLGRGLAQIDAPTGSFISYSTAPGKIALDGDQVNSPYTAALAKALQSPGIGIEQVFKKVRREVISVTNGQQTPWDSSSLIDDFYPKPQFSANTNKEISETELFWRRVRASEDPNRVALFLQAFPESEYVTEATTLFSRLLKAQKGDGDKDLSVANEMQRTSDRRAFAVALESGDRHAFEDYLSRYPNGIFVDLARRRVADLQRGEVSHNQTPHYFDRPWYGEKHNPENRSLKQLIVDFPLYPPEKGLPVKSWATVQCQECHGWTKDTLCLQGQTYDSPGYSASSNAKHPYGGFFKKGIRIWAEQGCR